MVRGRFAPSPTGRMHLGNVYAALMSYRSAREQGGEWILRIEDIDPQRSKPEWRQWIEDDLDWLGLQWDAEYIQSERFDRYELALDRLREQGLVYPFAKTRRERLQKELTACGAPQANDDLLLRSEAILPCPLMGKGAGGKGLAIRIGDEDIILRRSDGAWAYQLAVVVDDAEMGITEVVRGCDLEPSVKYHHYLQDCLGYPHPEYKHLPLLCNEAGQRLSKRDKSLDMSVLRQQYDRASLLSMLDTLSPKGERESMIRL